MHLSSHSVWRVSLLAALTLFSTATVRAQAEDADAIVIGASLPLSGPNAPAGQEGLAVAKAYFDSVNRNGGIQGRRLVLRALDDGFDPARAAENARTLAAGKAVALFNCWGSSSCNAMLPVITDLKLPMVSGIAGVGPMRKTPGRYAFNVRPTTTDEVARMVLQMSTVGQNRVAVVYQDDGFGKGALAAAQPVLGQAKVTPLAELALAPDASNLAAVFDKIKATEPNAIILLASPKATVALITAVRQAGLVLPIYNLAAQANRKVVQDLGKYTSGVIFTTLVPSPWRRGLATVQAYQEAYRAATDTENFSYLGLEVFINANVLVDGLRQAGRAVNRESLVNALETMGERAYSDLMRVRYGPNDRDGSRYVGITIIGRDGRFAE